MSTTKKTELRLKVNYLNHDYRTYAYDVNDSILSDQSALQGVKDRINAFNQAAADTTSNIHKTFVSDSGSHIQAITEANIRYTESEVIYNG